MDVTCFAERIFMRSVSPPENGSKGLSLICTHLLVSFFDDITITPLSFHGVSTAFYINLSVSCMDSFSADNLSFLYLLSSLRLEIQHSQCAWKKFHEVSSFLDIIAGNKIPCILCDKAQVHTAFYNIQKRAAKYQKKVLRCWFLQKTKIQPLLHTY